MNEWKVRAAGTMIASGALSYYLYEVCQHVYHWYPLSQIEELTECWEAYIVEVWLLTQNFVWCFSVMLVLVVLLYPDFPKLVLCFMYVLGPLFFIWTLSAGGFLVAFLVCCEDIKDNCIAFYPYSNTKNLVALFVVALLYSGVLSALLINLVLRAVLFNLANFLRQN